MGVPMCSTGSLGHPSRSQGQVGASSFLGDDDVDVAYSDVYGVVLCSDLYLVDELGIGIGFSY
jgi:hypothetical protein